jgi:hypothetical protein
MARPSVYERFGRVLDTLESRWSLYVHGATVLASFGLPAWAAKAAGIFSAYAPLSWVIAGFLGVFAWAIIRLVWNFAYRIKVNAKFDAQAVEHSADFNPLDLTFERKRIYISDLVLPSHPFIDGKTFIDCDLIGPATIYFHSNNQANPIRPPRIDAAWLSPTAMFGSAFTFTNCIFRNCSFQRITMLASIENYEGWKDNPNVNWVSLPPTDKQIIERKKAIYDDLKKQGLQIPPQLTADLEDAGEIKASEDVSSPK